MKFKKGDRVSCFGYDSSSTHYHNGCLATVCSVDTEPGCISKTKNEITIGVVFDDYASIGTVCFHPKQLVKSIGRKKKK